MLNDGRKKDLFEPFGCEELSNGYLILAAKNKENGVLFNVVDKDGKAPDGYSANWRVFQHVEHELKRSTQNK